jgi:phospholipid/cholesterol/gamma-HCH transport system substrate-binding protein
MNKQLRQYFKVGVTLVVSLALLFFGISYLRGRLNSDKPINIIFDDAQGISKGEIVQMAGVEIGQVDDVNLVDGNKAQVVVGIHRRYHIPKDSHFQITTGVLGNTRKLTITPNPRATGEIKDGETVTGISSSPFDELNATAVKANNLLSTLETAIGDPKKRERQIDALLRDSNRITQNTAKITEDLKAVTADLPEMKMQIDLAVADLRSTLGSTKRIANGAEGLTRDARQLTAQAQGVASDARKLTRNLDTTVTENRATIKSLLQSADEAASAVAGLTDQVRTTLTESKLKENLQTATNNLASISGRLDNVASNLEKLASDPKLSSDIRETVSNLRETSASVRNLAGRLETVRIPGERRTSAGGGKTTAPPFSATSLLEPGFVFDSLYDTKVGRLRVDTNYTLLSGARDFYRLGLYDATESNQLNLEFGRADGRPILFDYRAGVIAGKFGLGFDARTGPLDLRLDVFDPNFYQINIRAKAALNRNAAITAGVDSIGKENRATLGVQIRQ